jgi:hypothetical protein
LGAVKTPLFVDFWDAPIFQLTDFFWGVETILIIMKMIRKN